MIIKGLDCSNSSMSYAIQLAGLKTLQEQPSFISISRLFFFCNVGWEKISGVLLLLNLKTNWQLLRSEALSCLALNGLGTTFTANFPSFLFHNEPKRVSLSVLRQWGISSNHFPTSPRESLPNTLKKTCWAHSLFPRCNTQEPRRKKEGHYPHYPPAYSASWKKEKRGSQA